VIDVFNETLKWVRDDYSSNKFRFVVEVIAWVLSITCSLIMALTVPNPPLLLLYILWVSGCSMYAWAAFTRKSFGMLANYVLLTVIDTVGLIRVIAS
jgi:hypothetical protein